jgi:predicted Rossmann-fold nucleotide-binding protein
MVCGGASVELMGACADAALAGGAEVVGVLPRALVAREIAHHGLTELRVVGSLHERKAVMSALSDAVVALRAGVGRWTSCSR